MTTCEEQKIKRHEIENWTALVAAVLGFLAVLAFIVGTAWLWVSNIVTLVGTAETAHWIVLTLRVLGIFLAPLGVVMGFIE